jgi:hypothetical protein
MLNKTKLFVLAAAIMLGGLTVANAQVNPQSEIKTNVPFSFVVNGKTFKAGTYTFGRLDTSGGSDSSQLVMRGPKGETAIIDTIKTVASETTSKTHLVFEKIGGQNFLSQIWGAGDMEGSEITKTNAQAKAIAEASSGTGGESTSGVDGN